MDDYPKTQKELIAELQALKAENNKLKSLLNEHTLPSELPKTIKNKDIIDINYFEFVFNTSPDIAIISRLNDSKVIKVNDGFTKITGYSRQEALSTSILNINLWQNPDSRKLLLDELYIHSSVENIETTMVRKNGTLFRSLVSARLFNFEGEQYVSSITRDISDLKNAEDALRKSELEIKTKFAALNSIFESSQNIIIFSLDINYCYTAFTNLHKETMKLIWGVDIVVGMNMLELIKQPDDYKKAKANFDKVLKGEHLRFEEEYGDANLHRSYYEDIYNPIIDNNGVVVGLSVFVVDISDRKNAENALKDTEERFRLLFKHSGEAFLLTHQNGTIISANPEACKIFERTETEIQQIGRAGIVDLNDPRLKIALEERRKTGNFRGELNLLRKDGTIFPGDVSSIVYIDSHGEEKTSMMIRDISERKKAEAANVRTQKLLEASQRIGKIGGWELNIDTLKLDWTSEMYNIHEVDASYIPMVHKRVDFYTPETLKTIDDAVKRAIENEQFYEVEVEIKTAKGNYRTIRTTGEVDLKNRRIFGYFQDITERKKAEQALKESEEKFRLLFEQSPDAITITNENGEFIDCNSRALKALNADSLANIKKYQSMDFFVNEADRNFFVTELTEKGLVRNLELKLKSPNNDELRSYLVSAEVMQFQNKEPLIIVWTRDITDRKLAEDKLRNLFENAPIGIFHSIPSGRFITANPPLAKMLGYSSPEELIELTTDMTTQIYVDPNCRVDQINNLLNTDGWVHREDVLWRRKDGRHINVDMTGRKVLNTDGSIAYLEGFINDITDRKLAEHALIESEEKYKESQLIGNVAHWEYNFGSKKLYWSEQLYNIFEVEKNSFVPDLQNTLDLIDAEDRGIIQHLYLDSVEQNRNFEVESKFLTPAGTVKYIITRAKPKYDEFGKPSTMLATIVDITYLKKIELELKKTQEELRNFTSHLLKVRENEREAITLEIHDSVAQFLVALKMDIGIYIKKIASGVENVQVDEIELKLKAFVLQIDKTIQSARMIMNGLRPEQLELLGLVDSIEVHLNNFEEIHHLKCKFNNSLANKEIPQEHSIILFRIVQESLTNIIKHANATSVSVTLASEEGNLLLEITDNGVGFNEKSVVQSNSFGLISMKEQIKGLNGTFTVISKPGNGTNVTVKIPTKI